jgi:hypothetical protein
MKMPEGIYTPFTLCDWYNKGSHFHRIFSGYHYIGIIGNSGDIPEQTKAIAQFITVACNSHNKLVQALKEILIIANSSLWGSLDIDILHLHRYRQPDAIRSLVQARDSIQKIIEAAILRVKAEKEVIQNKSQIGNNPHPPSAEGEG